MVIEYKFEKVVKKTEGQIKKHITQFTSKEEKILRFAIDSMPKQMIKVFNHSKNHLNILSRNLVEQVLENYEIIEFNVIEKCYIERRVLIRSKKVLTINDNGISKKANICIVLEISTGNVITAYINCKDDKHDNINMKRYTADMDVVKYAMM